MWKFLAELKMPTKITLIIALAVLVLALILTGQTDVLFGTN